LVAWVKVKAVDLNEIYSRLSAGGVLLERFEFQAMLQAMKNLFN